MLTFFRRTRKGLHNSGAARKYTLYAIGEIALVVIGILIALQINNWNIDRVNRIEERKILGGIRISLNNDLVRFKTGLQNVRVAESRIKTLQEMIRSKTKVDSINMLCGAVYGIHPFDINTSSFEVLKSNGLNLIRDDTIRQLIVQIYDTHLKHILRNNSIETNVTLEALRPYYLSNFTNIRFHETASPMDIDKMYKDDYYHNLIDYRLTVLRHNLLVYLPIVEKDIEILLNRIDRYLET